MDVTATQSAESLTRDTPAGAYRRVYLWHWPIRAMHWIAAGCIVVLVVTGFYIGRPYFFTSGAASDHFLMGRFRFAHFTAAAVLVATGILRFYWLFAGNKFERWRALFPIRPIDWRHMVQVTKSYLFVHPEKAPHYLGHNPLQQLSYTAIYGLAVIQVFTGFYMYGLATPGGFFFNAFGWVGALLGGAQVVRFVHHVVTWLWLMFIPVHVYLAIRSDVVTRESTVSAIVSGHRYVPADMDFVDD